MLLALLAAIAPHVPTEDDAPTVLVPEGMELVDVHPPEGVPAQPAGRARAAGWAWRVREPISGMTFLLVEPGEYRKGHGDCSSPARCLYGYRSIEIERPFYLAETETSVGQWRRVLPSWNWKPSIPWTIHGPFGEELKRLYPNWPRIWRERDVAMDAVSWEDALRFAGQLNVGHELVAEDDGAFRLPSSSEWEYACRAGTTSTYSFGDQLDRSQAHLTFDSGESVDRPSAIYHAPRNPWGFIAMHGNVSEWCSDRYGKAFCRFSREFAPGSMSQAARQRFDDSRFHSELKETRGGNWLDSPALAASGLAMPMPGTERIPGFGVRLVREIPRIGERITARDLQGRAKGMANLAELEGTYGLGIRATISHSLIPETPDLWAFGLSQLEFWMCLEALGDELDRYPVGFFVDSGLDLRLRSAVYSQSTEVGGLYSAQASSIYVVLAPHRGFTQQWAFQHSLHHEVFHALESGVMEKDDGYAKWLGLNGGEAAYRGRPAYGFDAPTGTRPRGFVSEYAQVELREDLAETFEMLITDRTGAEELAAEDSIVAAKFEFLRERMPELFGD